MKKQIVLGMVAGLTVLVLSAGLAVADSLSMASGGGQSHRGASFGFNAKSDMSGDFQYNGVTRWAVNVSGTDIPAGTRFSGHCFDYSRVVFNSTTEASMFGLCRGMFFVGNAGPPVEGDIYLQAHVFDNGEPGTSDVACIDWGLNSHPGRGKPGVISVDCGVIENGNVQVKP